MQMQTAMFSLHLGRGIGEYVRQRRAARLKQADAARKRLKTCPFGALNTEHAKCLKATQALIELDDECGLLLAEMREQQRGLANAAAYLSTPASRDETMLKGVDAAVAGACRVLGGASVLYAEQRVRAAEALDSAAKALEAEIRVVEKGLQIGTHLAPVVQVKARYFVTSRRHIDADTKAMNELHREFASLERDCARFKALRSQVFFTYDELLEKEVLHQRINEARERLVLAEYDHNAAQQRELDELERDYVAVMKGYRAALGRQNVDTVTRGDLAKSWRTEA